MLAEFIPSLPTMLLSADRYHPYPTISERAPWNGLPEKVRRAWIAEGEKLLAWEWPQLTATQFMEFARTGNRDNFEKLSFARRNALTTLVIAECMEDSGRFLDDIVNGIWAICEESFWGVPAHNYGKEPLPDVEQPYVDLFAGETAGLLAWTHYLLQDRLDSITPRIAKRIRHEIKVRILDPYLERTDFWWFGFDPNRKVNNWNPWCHANCLTTVLLMEHDHERRTAAVAKALRSLDIFLDTYHSDGGCDEGTSYWSRAGGSLFDCLELLFTATNGALSVYDRPLIQEIGRFLFRAHIDGDWFINFADGNARVHIASDLVYRYGKRIGDPQLMALGAYSHHLRPESGLRHKDSMIRDLAAVFGYAEIEAASIQPPYVRDVWLDGIQVMAAREKEGSAEGLYLAAKGGHNDESHNHNDVGNFIVYANGEPSIIDAGVETYTQQTFSSRRYELWTMQSAYHNLPSINGHQQLPGASYRATNVTYLSDARCAEFAMDLNEAYPAEAGITTWRRTIRLVRDGADSAVELEDAFELQTATDQVVLHLMVASEPQLASAGILSLPAVTIEFDSTLLAASWERIALTDARLRGIWGEALYRIKLHVTQAVDRGVLRLKVRQA